MKPQFLELYLRGEAIKIEVEAMKVANEERRSKGEAQAYPEASFMDRVTTLGVIADYVNQLSHTVQ